MKVHSSLPTAPRASPHVQRAIVPKGQRGELALVNQHCEPLRQVQTQPQGTTEKTDDTGPAPMPSP
jgi:hypothetical protein